MKITDIKTFVVNAQLRNWVFVMFETGVPGLYGWGEGTMEWKTRDVPWHFDVVQTRLKAQKGYWQPLDEPGLGVEIHEAEARRYPFEQETLEQMVFHPDGSVAEWRG
jgi:L-alanine-DL-glutamate epimerase-like enolase superfamily enzyme